jgi:hypothetical protein
MIGLLRKAYDLDRANVVFKDLAPADVRRALETKELRVVLLVIPLAEKYLVPVRGLFPQNAKTAPVLIPIDFAGAIARRAQTEGAGTGFALCAGAKDKRR